MFNGMPDPPVLRLVRAVGPRPDDDAPAPAPAQAAQAAQAAPAPERIEPQGEVLIHDDEIEGFVQAVHHARQGGAQRIEPRVPAELEALYAASDYALAVNLSLLSGSLTEAQCVALINTFGNADREAAMIQSLPVAKRESVLMHTVKCAPWRPLMTWLPWIESNAVKRDFVQAYADMGRIPGKLSFAEKELLAAAVPRDRDILHAICMASPIFDWPSRESVDHVIRMLNLVPNDQDEHSDLDLVWFMVSSTTAEVDCSLQKPSQATDALLVDLFRCPRVGWRKSRCLSMWKAVSENWPNVDAKTVLGPVVDRAPSLARMLYNELTCHNHSIGRSVLRAAISHHRWTRHHKDQKTDVQSHQCVVCWDNRRACTLRPCNHAVMCMTCIRALEKKECPLCKTQIEAWDELILS